MENFGQVTESTHENQDESYTRLLSSLEHKILSLSKEDRDKLLFDSLEQLNEAESTIHMIHRVNEEYGQ